MFSLSSFKKNDVVLRILPGILLLLFVAAEIRSNLTTDLSLNTTEIFFLIVIASYPLGIVIEQFSVTAKGLLLKHTKYSEQAQIFQHLGYGLDEFWNKNIILHSQFKPELIMILDYYNLLRCFFLNMTTTTIIAVIIQIITNKQIFSILNDSLFVMIVVFIMYHFKHEHYYYYIFSKITSKKKALTAKQLSQLYRILKPPKPPKPPKLPKFLR